MASSNCVTWREPTNLKFPVARVPVMETGDCYSLSILRVGACRALEGCYNILFSLEAHLWACGAVLKIQLLALLWMLDYSMQIYIMVPVHVLLDLYHCYNIAITKKICCIHYKKRRNCHYYLFLLMLVQMCTKVITNGDGIAYLHALSILVHILVPSCQLSVTMHHIICSLIGNKHDKVFVGMTILF